MTQVEQMASIIHSAAMVTALVVGGIWTYWLFVRKRQIYPRASIAHHSTHRDIGEGKTLLHVDVTVSNNGDVLVSLVESETRVQQVLPLTAQVSDKIVAGIDPVKKGDTEVPWPHIGRHRKKWEPRMCEIEPGDSQQINHDFIVDSDVETIEIYSYVLNEKNVRASWHGI